MVGFGSDNSRGIFDNVTVQKLPPEYTFVGTEEFSDTLGDGEFGLLSKDNSSSFDKITVKTDDPAFSGAALAAEYDTATTVEEMPVTISVLTNDLLGSEPTTITEVSDPRNGTVVYDAQAGTITYTPYTPNATFTGTDSFTYTITDNTGKTSSATVSIVVTPAGANLVAYSAPEEPPVAESILTCDALAAIVEEAIERWSDSLLVDDSALALLNDVSFEITDLNGLTLGHATGSTVLIDVDAAGFGWFIDPTPYDDTEFRRGNGDGELAATPPSAAYDDMDLLTVVMHELGHVLGLEDLDPDTHDLMSETLDAGVRGICLPDPSRPCRCIVMMR